MAETLDLPPGVRMFSPRRFRRTSRNRALAQGSRALAMRLSDAERDLSASNRARQEMAAELRQTKSLRGLLGALVRWRAW